MGILNTELIEKEENSDEGVKNVSENTNMDSIQEEEKSSTIVLNGPLSDIMAKALNMVLSNESAMFTQLALYSLHKDKIDKEKISDDDLYVYCTSSDKIVDDDTIVNTIDSIKEKSKGYENVIVSVESEQINKFIQTFNNLCLENNYKVFTNTKSTAKYILNNYNNLP